MFNKILSILFISFLSAELALRILGYKNWQPRQANGLTENSFDSKLGWVREFHNKETDSDIWFVGGSFTRGDGLNEGESFVDLLNERESQKNIVNFGVNAYGTYQSFLLTREKIKERKKPKKVIYGFVDFHEFRNVAHWQWLKGLAMNTTTGSISLPYCRLNSNKTLNCSSSRVWPNLPGRNIFALSSFIEEISLRFEDKGIKNNIDKVTIEIIKEFGSFLRKQGIGFNIVFLASVNKTKNIYLDLFKENGIKVSECIHPKSGSEELTLKSNGHPNALHNLYWADCIQSIQY